MWAGVGMRGWMTALDAICAWVNPGFVLVAIALALLNLTVAAQRWTVVHPAAPIPVRTVVVTVAAAQRCSPVPRAGAARHGRA